jgi:hypothetical protein
MSIYNNALTNNQKTIEILIFDTKSMKYVILFKVKKHCIIKAVNADIYFERLL